MQILHQVVCQRVESGRSSISGHLVSVSHLDRPRMSPGSRQVLLRTPDTVFGVVSVERLAYRHRGAANLHPADAALNLPGERHSHGLRRLAAVESTRGS